MKLSQIKPLDTLDEGVSMAPTRLSVVLDDPSIRCGFEAEWFDKSIILETPTDIEDLKSHPDFNAELFASYVDKFKEENWHWEDDFVDEEQVEEEVWNEHKVEMLKAMGLDITVPISKVYMSKLVTDFEEGTGIKIKEHCVGYNCANKSAYDGYFLETDGFGPELISPPQIVQKTLTDLKKFLRWLDARPSAITTKDKGLHFGVSIKGVGKGDVDFLKMALFLGESHLLSSFGRLGNNMTAPHLPHVFARIEKSLKRDKLTYGHIDIKYLLDDPKVVEELITALNKMFENDKFRSFNVTTLNKPDPYIEFRIPGNEGYEKRYEEIKNLVLRIAFVMKLATDKDMEKNEYMKKLYKLFDTVKDTVEHAANNN
jgi:hypothetical protein